MAPLVLHVPEGVPVRGRVVYGWPLPEKLKVRVSADVPGVTRGKAAVSVEMAEDGTFCFPQVGPGSYTVWCHAEGRPWKTQLEVTTAPPREVILRVGE
jgi:hypothetical protein